MPSLKRYNRRAWKYLAQGNSLKCTEREREIESDSDIGEGEDEEHTGNKPENCIYSIRFAEPDKVGTRDSARDVWHTPTEEETVEGRQKREKRKQHNCAAYSRNKFQKPATSREPRNKSVNKLRSH